MILRVELDELARASAAEILGEVQAGDAVASLVDAEACFFVAASAGLVLGLRLRDGSRVALKLVRPRRGLTEARRIQAALHDGGFPCPRPLLGPVAIGRGVAFVDEWREGEQRDLHEPSRRRAAARLLVGQASLVFPSTWDIPVASYVADPAESEAFVREYEEAAGRRLDRERVAAARTYLLAYCARCELSDLGGAEGDFQRALRTVVGRRRRSQP